jgi:hypothetical protein
MRADRTRSLVRIALALGVAVAILELAAACLDMTPLYVEPREAGATLDGAACLGCLSKPNAELGCADQIGRCVADPRCKEVYDCMIVDSCLERVVFDDKIACTLPCLTEAGIVSTNDPTVGVLVDIVKCGEQGCANECGLSEAGAGLGF